jgi:hypothetical protein
MDWRSLRVARATGEREMYREVEEVKKVKEEKTFSTLR